MKYKHAMVAVACLLVPVGLLLLLDPARVSDSVGLPQSPELVRDCARYEAAKQGLVRVNGGHVLGVGVLALVLRPVIEHAARKRILIAMLSASSIGIVISLAGLVGGNTTGLIWIPVVLQGTIAALLAAGLYGLRGPRPVDADR